MLIRSTIPTLDASRLSCSVPKIIEFGKPASVFIDDREVLRILHPRHVPNDAQRLDGVYIVSLLSTNRGWCGVREEQNWEGIFIRPMHLRSNKIGVFPSFLVHCTSSDGRSIRVEEKKPDQKRVVFPIIDDCLERLNIVMNEMDHGHEKDLRKLQEISEAYQRDYPIEWIQDACIGLSRKDGVRSRVEEILSPKS